MSDFTHAKRITMVASALVAASLSGCGIGGTNGLPQSVTINLPDGTTTEAALGSGAHALANSTWAFSQSFAGGTTAAVPFITITFGPNGEFTSFDNNTIAPEIFGDTILFDGQLHSIPIAGLSYAAATFGASTADDSGFAFVGEINAFTPFVGKAATATASASGEFDPDNPDVITGTFSFVAQVLVTLPGIPTETIEQTMGFRAERVN